MLNKQFFILVLMLSLLSACTATNPERYYWGSYEGLLYKMYAEPGSAQAAEQIAALEKDMQKAERSGKPLPPGVIAHLGFMYAAAGDIEKAEEAFNIEKKLYPESQVLLDGMLKRAAKSQK